MNSEVERVPETQLLDIGPNNNLTLKDSELVPMNARSLIASPSSVRKTKEWLRNLRPPPSNYVHDDTPSKSVEITFIKLAKEGNDS